MASLRAGSFRSCRGHPSRPASIRLNKVKETRGATSAKSADVECSPPRDRDADLPETFVDYDENPREYFLNAVTTVLDVQTRVSDLYSRPYDQIQEQLRLLIEKVKERQESELINNKEYGLLANAAPSMRISTRAGAPDAGRSRRADRQGLEGAGVLPRPSARHRRVRPRVHAPRRAAADRDAVRLAVPHLARPAARAVRQGAARRRAARRSILLLRTGEKKQGVVGLFQPGLPGEARPGLSVRFMGINRKAIASYLISLYCSLAVHDGRRARRAR